VKTNRKERIMNNKKSISVLLALSILLIIFSGMAVSASESTLSTQANSTVDVRFTDDFLATASEHRFEGHSIDDIRKAISDGGQIYQNFRMQSETTGTMTYRVPVQDSDIEYLMSIQDNNTSTTYSNSTSNSNPFPVTKIRDSGKPDEDSIVIILFGDGFTAGQYGNWPNPAQGTVLHHADNAINAMLATHPFGLFSHLFSVYVIHTTGINPTSGFDGYLGTVTDGGNLTSASVRQYRIRELADAIVSPASQTMIQVISNATDGTGFAFMSWHYMLSVDIGVTSIRRAAFPVGGHNILWPDGTAWHGTFVHEFGHSFGQLVDEHADGGRSELRTNSTAIADVSVKWRHWAGHRNVLATPTRFSDGWAVPAAVSDFVGHSGCLMRASWGNRNFCGVCAAELVRRMALVSGETFHGISPSTGNSLPNTPIVSIPQGSTRILDSAFHGNTSLQTIVIPAAVDAIGDFAFIGATGLRAIVNYSVAPQQINATTFVGLNRANIDVLIRPGTTQAYIAAGWGGFRLVENVLTASASDLAFNGTFSYNTVEFVGSSALSGVAVHVEIRKHSGSNVTTAATSQIVFNQSGIGWYSPAPISARNFESGEFIEILVYADDLKQTLFYRHLINPAVFSF